MKGISGGEDWREAAEKLKDFDDILEMVGSEGKYQKLILYGVVTPITMAFPFLVLQWIFMLSIPDHWCHVPGKPDDTSLFDWKNQTLPIVIGPDGQERFSRCEMYDFNKSSITCHEWEYDTTNYDATIATEFDWVCSDSKKVANSFSVPSFGNVLGTMALGIASDKYGRKTVYFFTLLMYLIFYYSSLFLTSSFGPFIIFRFLTGMTYNFMFFTPCLIAAELSGKNYRAWIYSVIWIAWVFGNCLVPLVAYLTRSWFVFGIISPVPGILLFLYYKTLEESPRWLISVGRTKEAGKIIQKLSRYNGTTIHPQLLERALENIKKIDLEKKASSKKNTLGVWSLFSRRRLAMNTILLCLAWTASGLIYSGLTLNTTSMSGNQFLNYFYLGIVELPAGWLGGFVAEKFGRRWTQALFFLLCSIAFSVASISVFNPDLPWIVLAAALCCKFCVSVTSLVVYLQGTELFPTQLRSTGSALASTVSSVLGILGPYIVYLGQVHAAAPYFILAIVAIIGTLSSVCLPETLDQKLPETLEDAERFGKFQKFFSFLPKEESKADDDL
ncbi:unnamed protein product [Allacma fusca]|uniref:Major facilitator superfamily (MFS) profile domain-containing protein n=1 Tax=Allacma fusca TaxID=39272 RepID=A0A8J2P6M3_9HEXA|nr:unnamed protein product [Allacma fusca]